MIVNTNRAKQGLIEEKKCKRYHVCKEMIPLYWPSGKKKCQSEINDSSYHNRECAGHARNDRRPSVKKSIPTVNTNLLDGWALRGAL